MIPIRIAGLSATMLPLLLALACTGDGSTPDRVVGFPVDDTVPTGDTPPATPPGESAPGQQAPDEPADQPASDDPVAAFLARVPPEVLVREGACPFECCVYRTWRAQEPIPVLASARRSATRVATIGADADFEALGGEVRVAPSQIVVVTEPMRAFAPGGRELELAAGDTIVPLDNVGEGYVNAWVPGEGVWQVPMVWMADTGGVPPARAIGTWETAWWVRVHAPDGQEGWILADQARFTNADRCA